MIALVALILIDYIIICKRQLASSNWSPRYVSRREYAHYLQTHDDVRKASVLLLWFMLPTVGFLAPLMGCLFPRQLMTQQFWSDEQRIAVLDQE